MIALQQHLNLPQTFKSILCLDGDMPTANFFKQWSLPIIAADGAANQLAAIGIHPDLVIGDLDSLHPHLCEKLKTLHVPDQNYSDYQKALTYLRTENLLPTIICGIHGGDLDHVLNNINIFLQNNDNVLYANNLIGHLLPAGSVHTYSLPLNSKISLFGMPNAIVCSSGLKWELTDYTMSFPGSNSCSNRTTSKQTTLQVKQGTLLVLIHLAINSL